MLKIVLKLKCTFCHKEDLSTLMKQQVYKQKDEYGMFLD